LPGVDDNFKAVKLYDLLKKGKHKEFEEYAQKCQNESATAYTFNSDTNTGLYYDTSKSQITLTTGGTKKFTV